MRPFKVRVDIIKSSLCLGQGCTYCGVHVSPAGQAVCSNALQALHNSTAGFGFPLRQPQDPLICQHDVARHINHHIPELLSRPEKKGVKSHSKLLLNRLKTKTK